MKQAVILAGGQGTRLRERLGSLPKPLVDVAGRPLLDRQLDHLARFGFNEALLLVSYAKEDLQAYSRRRGDIEPHVRIIDDGVPAGTAGALLAAMDELRELFLVVYGDTLFDIDLDRLWEVHEASGRDVTLVVHPNDHPADSDLVQTDLNGAVVGFHPYPHPQGTFLPNLVNAAMYVVNKNSLLPWLSFQKPSDLMKDLFPQMLGSGSTFHAYKTFEYIKDIGTPARLDKAVKQLDSGAVSRASLSHLQKAVFLDRDGTLNVQRDYVRCAEELTLFGNAAEAIKLINDHEFRAILVTNQPVLARGECTFAELKRIHDRLESDLGTHGAFLDDILFCPHHPDKGFAGEVAALKGPCACRKPQPGMIEEARQRFNIDLSSSWLVGDSRDDVLAARAAGVRSVLVRTGQSVASDVSADFCVEDVLAAAQLITTTYPDIAEQCGPMLELIPADANVAILRTEERSLIVDCLRSICQHNGVHVEVLDGGDPSRERSRFDFFLEVEPQHLRFTDRTNGRNETVVRVMALGNLLFERTFVFNV